MDLVLYFGARDSPEARDSVFRFRRTAGLVRPCAGFVGLEGFLFKEPGEGRDPEFVLGGVARAAVCAAAEGSGRVKPFWFDFGVSKGFKIMPFVISESSGLKGFSLPSLGLRDSVEPLFLRERVGGRSLSVNRASSICRRAI